MFSASTLPPASRQYRSWLHILGLEAVVAALVWLPLFTRAMGVKLRPGPLPVPPEYILLGCAVWCIYAADRILDGIMHRGPREERHCFAARQWIWLSLTILVCMGVCAWLLLFHVQAIILFWGLKLSVVVVCYFAITWLSRQAWAGITAAGGLAGLLALGLLQDPGGILLIKMWRAVLAGFLITVTFLCIRHPGAPAPWALPRKLLGGLLFATGTALAPYARVERWPELLTNSTVLLFGMVCMLNSLAIHLRERESNDFEYSILNALYPWMALTVVAGAAMEFGAANAWSRPVLAAAGLAALLLLVLHLIRRVPPDLLRILADAAIIVPAVIMLLIGPR